MNVYYESSSVIAFFFFTFLQCDNVEVTGAPSVAIILNKTPNTWGGESGANIKGVAVGISWDEKTTTDGLTATDIVRYTSCVVRERS